MIRKKKNPQNARKLDQLNMAITCNDLNTINELLLNNSDLNCPDSRGAYPIMYAVEYGNANTLISLLRHGANANIIN